MTKRVQWRPTLGVSGKKIFSGNECLFRES